MELSLENQDVNNDFHPIESEISESFVLTEDVTKNAIPASIPGKSIETKEAFPLQDKNPKEKFKGHLKMARSGNLEAAHQVGLAYLNGYGIPQDLMKAKEYFESVSQNINVSPLLKEESDKKIEYIQKASIVKKNTDAKKPTKTLPVMKTLTSKRTLAISRNKSKFENSKSERSTESSWGLRSGSQSQSESENGERFELVNILPSKIDSLADQPKGMTIEYTKKFDRGLKELSLSETEIKRLNQEIAQEPDSNNKPLIKHGGGARKARFAKDGLGKSGSIRIIYTFDPEQNKICMIEAYDKKNQADLTMTAKKNIKKFAREKITGIKKIAHPPKK